MDQSGLMVEILAEETMRDRERACHQLQRLQPVPPAGQPGVRGALAATLLRAALRLDPAAGERVGGLHLSPARVTRARPRA